MTKRAKLSLVEGEEKAGKKSTAFEEDMDNDQPDTMQGESVETSSQDNQQYRSAQEDTGATATEPSFEDMQRGFLPSWLNRKTVIKTVVVVGAVAVTAYLIHRRFRR